jgi:outer membrane protein
MGSAKSIMKHRGKTAISAVLLLLASVVALAQGAPKIAYVDMKRLLDNAPQVAAARKTLETEFRARDQQLQRETLRLAELREREKKDSALMPQSALLALRREIENLDKTIIRTRTQLRDELKKRQDQELTAQWPLIHKAVGDYARKHGYDLVVHAPVLYASAQIDITDRILLELKSTPP